MMTCRVCQCVESDSRGDAALGFLDISPPCSEIVGNDDDRDSDSLKDQKEGIKSCRKESGVTEFISPTGEIFICNIDLEAGSNHHEDKLIDLGCSCKNDLSVAHYACALKWFVSYGSTVCEICGSVAVNVRPSDFEKVVASLKDYEKLMEKTVSGEPTSAYVGTGSSVDPDALAGVRRQRLSEIALWFNIHISKDNSVSYNNSTTVSQVIEQSSTDPLEAVATNENAATKWAVEITGVLVATGLLTVTLAWLIAPRVGKSTAKFGLHILLGGVCALTVVIFLRFFVLTRIKYGPARYWAILFVFWFLAEIDNSNRASNLDLVKEKDKMILHMETDADTKNLVNATQNQQLDRVMPTLRLEFYSTICYFSSKQQKYKKQLKSRNSAASFESVSLVLMAEEKKKDQFDVESASLLVKELRSTFASGKTKSYEWRVSQLKSIVKMMEENESQITDALTKDLSKPRFESFVAEISMTKTSSKLCLKELKHWMKPEKVKTQLTTYPSSAEIVSEPLGAVLIISAWNYPILLSLDPVIGAIAAGNTVVLKPSEIAPASSALLAKLVGEYLDSSAIRVIEGSIPETSALLEQKWDKIFYTGNGQVGRVVMTAAAKHLTPVVLELGGKSPVVVDSNINLKVAVRRIVYGKWACNNGQACIAPDYIITTKAFAPTLIDALRCVIEEFYGKDPFNSNEISRVVNSNHFARLTKLLDEDNVSDKIVYGGQRDKASLKIAPTILLDVPEDSLIMQEEIFGPLLPILTVDNIEESFDLIQSKSKPLAAYLFTTDKELEKKFVSTISSGGMVVNDTVIHLTNHTLPFGGVGESGIGSYHGKFSFDAFTHKKAVMYRGFGGDASARYPPYTPKKQKLLTALLKGDIIGAILVLLGWV
ncbi:Aldehyde dehydrogenase [Thalictrum thalictroides]|uniref:aldehyde dehydrogenase (NAD(+)) n=1 Tax=Thalictrum thalictroides TaxID=46969 RepID=A0A7J6VBW8_THATH|nr:Aldehyde dehydrogenase [Thalictrum thalictroides]